MRDETAVLLLKFLRLYLRGRLDMPTAYDCVDLLEELTNEIEQITNQMEPRT